MQIVSRAVSRLHDILLRRISQHGIEIHDTVKNIVFSDPFVHPLPRALPLRVPDWLELVGGIHKRRDRRDERFDAGGLDPLRHLLVRPDQPVGRVLLRSGRSRGVPRPDVVDALVDQGVFDA